MTFQQCSGAVRFSTQLALSGRGRALRGGRALLEAMAAMAASAALAACSGAGGGADDNPFAAGATGGGAPLANSGSGGTNSSPAQGGTMNESPDDNMLDTPGLVEPDPDETTPMMVFPEAPSCAGGEPTDCQDESCCLREAVATAAELMTVATNVTVQLSDYQLDKFEVTVGRFRAFVDVYDDWRDAGNPESASGAHPYTPGSGWDKDPIWEVALPGSAAVLRVGLNCDPNQQTWTDEPGFNELKPINCVSWYEAFAFCVWDEGRLPTEAEWQYAAVGGAQARQFAWGNTPLEESFASYACAYAGARFPSCTADDIPEVGTHPNGDGRFGQADLIGSVYEWALDWFAPYPELMREDYAKTDMGTQRVLRGGAWNSTATEDMLATARSFRAAPDARSPITGIRCARAAVDDPR